MARKQQQARVVLCVGSQLTDAEIRPEDYSIYHQLTPRLSLYARIVSENGSIVMWGV